MLADVAAYLKKQKEGSLQIAPPPPQWIAAQNRALTVDAFVQFINDLKKGGLNNDLQTLAAGLKLAGMLPYLSGSTTDIQALENDSNFVSLVSSVLTYFQQHNSQNGFAAASAGMCQWV